MKTERKKRKRKRKEREEEKEEIEGRKIYGVLDWVDIFLL